SKVGAKLRHGPHQLAQTSSSSGRSPFICCAKLPWFTSKGLATSTSFLQRPQRGCWLTRSAGMRLSPAQYAQGTTSESVMGVLLGCFSLDDDAWRVSGPRHARAGTASDGLQSQASANEALRPVSPSKPPAPVPGRQECRRYARYRSTAAPCPAVRRLFPAPRR